MKRKRIIVIPLFFLLFACFAGCNNNHEDEDDVVMVMFTPLQTEVPYQPMDISTFPGSLGVSIKKDYMWGIIVYMGTWNGETVYDYWAGYMSSFDGFVYDKEGEPIPYGSNYFHETKDWKCVFYTKVGGELF